MADENGQRANAPPAARRKALHQAILQRGFVTVVDIAREVGVSEMTVRRDLEALEREGRIRRSHGGAVPVAGRVVEMEPSFAARRDVNAAGKHAIARAAAALVMPREIVGLDVGSTVAALAAELRDRAGLGVVTNSIQAVLAMSGRMQADVYVLGGQLRPREGSLCGRIARQQLREHWLDKVFIGIAGIDAAGVFDYSVEEADMKCAFMERASEVIVLCDSSKFARRSLVHVCGFGAVHRLVTDAPPSPELQRELDRHNVQVIVAAGDALDLPAAG
jgi:DeoR/GlpR family transcriptional regulator of sugar metabolism